MVGSGAPLPGKCIFYKPIWVPFRTCMARSPSHFQSTVCRLLTSEVPFSSESPSSRKFPGQKPRDEVEETAAQPKGLYYQIFLFVFFIFQGWVQLCDTMFFPFILVFKNVVLPLTETIAIVLASWGAVCGGDRFRIFFWPSHHREGEHLPRCSWQLPAAISLCLLIP